jgi:hypothetical protein
MQLAPVYAPQQAQTPFMHRPLPLQSLGQRSWSQFGPVIVSAQTTSLQSAPL